MLPDSVEIDGKPYRINTDFRAGLAYCMAMTAAEPVREETLLRLFFQKHKPENRAAALSAVSDFLRCGNPREERVDTAETRPLPYSFFVDSAAIQAEFQRVYGIDLFSVKMHWWRFCALLRGLISHSFSERVKYRIADLGQIHDDQTRKYWREMKELYALDEFGKPRRRPQTVEEYNEMLLAQARGERW